MTLFSPPGASNFKVTTPFIRILGLILIFLAALFIRIDPVLMTPEPIRAGFGPFGDSFLYHNIAYNLYKGHGYSGIDNGSAFGLPQSDRK